MKSVIGMGNALTDILINLKNDEILDTFKLPRGSMNLVDSELQRQIDASVADAPHTLSLGGSASNTIRALARMGASTGYIGKVGRDETGDFFERTLNELQIAPTVFRGDEPSGRCVSLVSPDGERTMCTYLGAALEMRHTELTPEIFDGYEYFYIEGYLVQDHELISNAVRIAKERGLQVALDLASFNIVEENLGFLHDLVDRHVDILFANEQEAAAFTGEKNPLEALDKIARKCSIAVVKVGTRGAYGKHRGRVDHIGIMGNARRVDSTGAGDFYAAGFLFGLCRGLSMEQCGTIGSIAAGKVIEVVGTTFDEKVWEEIRRMVGDVGDELADHAFAVEAVGGVDDVHDLARAILALAARGDREHARVELDEPAGHRVGRRADDDVDAGAVGCVERAVHVGEVEHARLRFAGAPRGFGDADDVQPRSLHHFHILIDAVDAFHHEVFVIVCCAKKDVVHFVATHGFLVPYVFADYGRDFYLTSIRYKKYIICPHICQEAWK